MTLSVSAFVLRKQRNSSQEKDNHMHCLGKKKKITHGFCFPSFYVKHDKLVLEPHLLFSFFGALLCNSSWERNFLFPGHF